MTATLAYSYPRTLSTLDNSIQTRMMLIDNPVLPFWAEARAQWMTCFSGLNAFDRIPSAMNTATFPQRTLRPVNLPTFSIGSQPFNITGYQLLNNFLGWDGEDDYTYAPAGSAINIFLCPNNAGSNVLPAGYLDIGFCSFDGSNPQTATLTSTAVYCSALFTYIPDRAVWFRPVSWTPTGAKTFDDSIHYVVMVFGTSANSINLNGAQANIVPAGSLVTSMLPAVIPEFPSAATLARLVSTRLDIINSTKSLNIEGTFTGSILSIANDPWNWNLNTILSQHPRLRFESSLRNPPSAIYLPQSTGPVFDDYVGIVTRVNLSDLTSSFLAIVLTDADTSTPSTLMCTASWQFEFLSNSQMWNVALPSWTTSDLERAAVALAQRGYFRAPSAFNSLLMKRPTSVPSQKQKKRAPPKPQPKRSPASPPKKH